MKKPTYRDRDYAFGQMMLTLRTAIGLTQAALAEAVGVSRRAVGEWESGSKYPKPGHLKHLITLAAEQGAFPPGRAADEIRTLWKAAHQKVLLDEVWLAALVPADPPPQPGYPPAAPTYPTPHETHIRRPQSYGFPFQPTAFVGRGAELTEMARLLRDPACRLLTLIGPGGVGKTRLALEAAAGQASSYEHGAAFISLAAVGAPNQMVSAICDTLQLPFNNDHDPTKLLLDTLRERQMLLVLDNFEHLLDGAGLVYDLLAYAPRITILVTSRERLNLRAEWLFDVRGLAYPRDDPTQPPLRFNVTTVSGYSAVQLFVQRLAQVQHGFTLSEAALRTIVRICQHVVGMPLAIELAAAGVRMMPLDEIDRQIRSNLDVLATSLRDMPARHRSLRAVFDHSWHLMSAEEQAAFAHLGVFRGAFTAESAAQVTGAPLDTLLTLSNKSLLRQQTTRTGAHRGVPRFLMLEPLREYALDKLEARNEGETLRHAHARYYLSVAQTASAQRETPTAPAALEEIDHALDNLRAALQWSTSGGDPLLGLKLAEALVRYWRSRVYLDEAQQWLERLLALTSGNTSATALALRMRTTYATAMIFADRRNYAHAGLLFEQSRALRHALGEGGDEATGLINQSQLARTAGDYQRSTALLEEALTMYRAAGEFGGFTSGGYGFVLYFLAHMLREQGDFDRASALYRECRAFHLSIGDREGAAQGLLGLSDIARDLGDSDAVRRTCGECLVTYREFGTQWAIGFCLNNLALAAHFDGEQAEARALISESVAMFRAQKSDGSLAEVLVTLGIVLLAQGAIDDAYDALVESLSLGRASSPRILVAAALEALGGVLVPRGQARLAITALATAAALRSQMGAPIRPSDRASIEAAVAAARRATSDVTFTAVWATGQMMPVEQVVAMMIGGEKALAC
jgi:predicted ATPase/transcriptional regulator with XRE-family HTH domain